MSEIKVNLSLTLQEGAKLSEQECSGNSKRKKQNFKMEVRNIKGKNKEVLKAAIRKPKTVKQNIKLSKEAFEYMTSKDNCPTPKLKKKWRKFSVNQKLQYHCQQIAETLGAVDFTFVVLDD